MKGKIDDFGTGWFGLQLGIKESEIDDLIRALEALRESRSHFHLRSSFEEESGIGDIEIHWMDESEKGNLILDTSPPIHPQERTAEQDSDGNAEKPPGVERES